MKQENLVPDLRFNENKVTWKSYKLGDLVTFSKGKGLSKSDLTKTGLYKCIHYGQLFTIYRERISKIISKTNFIKGAVLSEKGDVLFPTSDITPTGLATASAIFEQGVVLGGDILVVRPHYKLFDSLFFCFQVGNLKKSIMRLVSGSTVYHLYSRDLSKLTLNLPSLPEQQKIADFLTSVDRKIQALSSKVALLKDYKKGVMQKIFNQEIRFKKDNGGKFSDWQEVRLNQLFKKVSEKGSDSLPLYSVTLNDGLQPRESLDRLIHNDSAFESNLIVRKDDIAYNMMRMWQGAFGVANQDCLVSPAYVVIRAKDKLNIGFFKNLFDTPIATYKFWSYSYGLTSDRLRLYPNDFLSIKFEVPSVQEQTKIAIFLTSIDKKIGAEENKLEKIKEWKKGLLQKMFV